MQTPSLITFWSGSVPWLNWSMAFYSWSTSSSANSCRPEANHEVLKSVSEPIRFPRACIVTWAKFHQGLLCSAGPDS